MRREDYYDLLKYLADNNIYFCMRPDRQKESIPWRAALVVDILEAKKTGKTWIKPVTSIMEYYGIPTTQRSSVSLYINYLVNINLLDETKVGATNQYTPNMNWKPNGALLLTSADKEISKQSRVVMSPRMSMTTARVALSKYLRDNHDLLYREQTKSCKYLLIARINNVLHCQDGVGPEADKLKAFWFNKLGVCKLPDLTMLDYDADKFWLTFTLDYFTAQGVIASIGERTPEWDKLEPMFWRKFTSTPKRIAMIGKASPWRKDYEEVKPVEEEPKVTPVSYTIGEIIKGKEVDSKAVADKVEEKNEVTDMNKHDVNTVNAKLTEQPAKAIGTIKQSVKGVIDGTMPAAVKVMLIKNLIEGKQPADDPKDITVLTNIYKVLDLEVDDAIWKTVVTSLLK